jgi:hypothetical protein
LAAHVGRIDVMRSAYMILVGKREGKIARGAHVGVDGTVILNGVGCAHVTQDRDQQRPHASTVVNFRDPKGRDFLTS